MKIKRLISYIMVFAMILSIDLGNLGGLIYSHAQDKNNLIIKNILNENPIATAEDNFLLEQKSEKISDTELKIDLNIKGKNQDISMKNVAIVNTLSDDFEITKDNVSISGIADNTNIKYDITSQRDTLTIESKDISSKEVNISFIAKIRNSANPSNDAPINLKSQINYTLQDDKEKIITNFPISKVSLEKAVENIKPYDENVMDSIKEDSNTSSIDKESIEIDNNNLEGYKSITNNQSIQNKTQSQSNIVINKIAQPNGDDKQKITLDVKGKSTQEEPKNADIVLVLDKSTSMKDKFSQVKAATKNFSKNVLNGSSKNVRISVVSYSYKKIKVSHDDDDDDDHNNKDTISQIPEGEASSVVRPFTNDLKSINRAIDNLSADGGTNTQDGIWRAQDILSHSGRDDAQKYVVFFTDGLPTQSNIYGGIGSYFYDRYFSSAQRQYYNHFSGWNNPQIVDVGGIGVINNRKYDFYEPRKIQTTQTPINAKFYSVGVFTDAESSTKNMAIKFLSSIQNVVNPTAFKDKYYTQDLNVVNSIFYDISEDIKANINNIIAREATIHDIVTKEFDIQPNSVKIIDLNGKQISVSPENIIINKNQNGEDEITLKIGDILAGTNGEGGVRVTFDTVLKDSYYGGKYIPTNVDATLNFKDSNNEFVEMTFPIPHIDIAYKKGSIKIIKEVITQNSKKNPNDRFSISVFQKLESNSNQKYTVDLTENKEACLNFYLKDKDTDISNNTDISTNYLTVGKFSVDEIVPMNYEKNQIWIDATPLDSKSNWIKLEEWDKYDASTKTFPIDKYNPNISIKVTNTLLNDNNWQDKANSINEFGYNL